MLKWLRDRNAPTRVAVIETLPVDGKRSVILVRRDNIEHLVMVGGRNDLVIEPNIMRRAAPSPARRPAPESKGLPPAPTREPLAEPLPKSPQHGLGELTRRLEAELRGSPPLRSRSSPPLRTEPRSSAQSDATSLDLEPRSKPRFDAGAEPKRTDPGRDPTQEAVADYAAEKDPAR
jgi:flagellar protein FliO/FliZ